MTSSRASGSAVRTGLAVLGLTSIAVLLMTLLGSVLAYLLWFVVLLAITLGNG